VLSSPSSKRRLLGRCGAGLELRLEDPEAVARIEGVDASFINELPRGATLLAAEEADELVVTDRHAAATLAELLVSGVLTLRLLGGKPLSESRFRDLEPFRREPPGSR
jgi:hypothetical protein